MERSNRGASGRIQRRVRLAFALIAAAAALLVPASATGTPRESQLQTIASRLSAAARSPGVVLVAADGGRVWRGSVGVSDRRRRAPMPLDARFRIASVSKTFLATVVLQLVGEGRLRLDDPIGLLLPGRSVGAGRVTVRQLLSHTSGIASDGLLTVAPGTFRYDNGNFVLLGEIVKAVTRASLRDVLAKRLVRPLGLTGTLWPVTRTPPRLARGYSPSGADVTALPPRSLHAADALVSTADDLRRFLTALLRGRLVPPAQLAAMQTSISVGKAYRPIDDRYGLGLMRYATPCGPAWGHRGRIDGYTSFAFGSPSGRRSVVVLLNVGRVSDSVVVRLNRLVFRALCA